jgi:hypothetical protein
METQFLKQYEIMKNLTMRVHEVNKNYYNQVSKNTLNLARKIVGRNLAPRNLIREAVMLANNKVNRAARTIQKSVLKIQPLLNDMRKDGRFKPNVRVLDNLFVLSGRVLKYINMYTATHPKIIINKVIGVCHYNVSPNTPVMYLKDMVGRLLYVAKQYDKKTPDEKGEYLDSLYYEISGRPCLENLLDSMIETLVGSVFKWKGKGYTVLVGRNNSKYLNNIMNTAVSTWKIPKNAPKNLNKRKQIFWNHVKHRTLEYINSGVRRNIRVSNYNKNGKKFKASNVSNYLNYK